jgi:hypothetical protein
VLTALGATVPEVRLAAIVARLVGASVRSATLPPGTVVHAVDPALTAAVAALERRLVELEAAAADRAEQARGEDEQRRARDAADEADRLLQLEAEKVRYRAREARVLALLGVTFTPEEQSLVVRADAIWDEP